MPAMIRIEVEDKAVRAVLTRLHAHMRDMRPFLKNAGEILVEGTHERFESMTDPEGHPWKALSPGYAAAKKRNRSRILTLSGQLGGTIRYQLSGSDTVLVGSNKIYAAIHQLGGTIRVPEMRPKNKKALYWPGAAHPVRKVRGHDVHMPARAYLGVGERDRVRLLECAEHYLAQAAGA
jgi:phage virion morphogenesis protein